MLARIHPSGTDHSSVPGHGASLTTLRQDRTRTLIRAVGEWDLAGADELAHALDAHERAGRRFIRLDVSAVTFLDCACLEVLVAAHARLLAARGTLVLTGVTPGIARLLSLARLDRVLLTTSLSDVDVPAGRSAVASRAPVVRPIIRPA
jgi:anti-anti-sigma factor